MREGIPFSVVGSSRLRRVTPLAQAVEVLQQRVETAGSGAHMQIDTADILEHFSRASLATCATAVTPSLTSAA
jgi:hypothetical protein